MRSFARRSLVPCLASMTHGLQRPSPSWCSGRSCQSAQEEDSHPVEERPRQFQQDMELRQLVQSAVPLQSTEDIKTMLHGVKNAKEVRHILETVVYRHHLCGDVLNGHGFRVTMLQSLTLVAPRVQAMEEWFDCLGRFRKLNFLLTRTFAAEGLNLIKEWLTHRFNTEGRTPFLLTTGTAYIRELMYWCHEDKLVFDHVLYTRIVFLLTIIVSFFDRQNLYRTSFPSDFVKRDGIVTEWIHTNERCVDYDECVVQCDALMEEVLDLLRNDIPSRPNFNLLFRLMDYYFATDNVEKLIAVMEDAHEYGVTVAESSTAKLMQLACAFNYPTAPELFLRWRVSLPQCAIASPDISRLLFYYSRSGGGLPCPACGEKYNHRNVNVYHWMATPPHQRQCPVLHIARNRKGDLEADPALPQNRDWSERALQLRELSTARSIEWGTQEWRGFLGCFMFAPTEKAMQAKALLDQSMGAAQMDDFLRAAYIRLLRYHAPELSLPVLRQWEDSGIRMSPIVLQEALMAAVTLDDSVQRLESLTHTWDLLREKGSYVMPFTRRYVERRRDALQQQAPLSGEESHIIREVVEMRPRTVSLLDRKDSSSDFVIGTSKKNIYIPKRSLKESERRQDQRRQRSQSE